MSPVRQILAGWMAGGITIGAGLLYLAGAFDLKDALSVALAIVSAAVIVAITVLLIRLIATLVAKRDGRLLDGPTMAFTICVLVVELVVTAIVADTRLGSWSVRGALHLSEVLPQGDLLAGAGAVGAVFIVLVAGVLLALFVNGRVMKKLGRPICNRWTGVSKKGRTASSDEQFAAEKREHVHQ